MTFTIFKPEITSEIISQAEKNDNFNIIKGEVLAHNQDYDKLYENNPDLKGKCLATEYSGKLDDNFIVVSPLDDINSN